MTSFSYRMGAGFPGDYNRVAAGATITPEAANLSFPIPAYGVPVKLVAAGAAVGPMVAGDTTAAFYGIITRPFPDQANPPTGYGAAQSLSTPAVPPTAGVVSIMRRGFIVVHVNTSSAAAAAKGGQVYVWTAAAVAGHLSGTIEATVSPGNTVAIPALFRGPADSSGNVEIELNL